MEKDSNFVYGFVWVCGFVAALMAAGINSSCDNADHLTASQRCQSLGYSAGHYEKEAGLVCEQWIEAAKLDRFPRKEATR